MSEPRDREIHAVQGELIQATFTVKHYAEIDGVTAHFEYGGDEQIEMKEEPEIYLTWTRGTDPEPDQEPFTAANVRTSTFELYGTVPRGAPLGTYRLVAIAFITGSERTVRFSAEDLPNRRRMPEQWAEIVIHVEDERPDRILLTDFRFLHDEG